MIYSYLDQTLNPNHNIEYIDQNVYFKIEMLL